MTITDLAIAAGIGLFVFSGFFEGFIKKIFGLIVLIIAFFVSINTYLIFSEWFQASFGWSQTFSSILAFLLVFLFILIFGNIIYRVVGKKNELYKTWDRLAGSAFGLIEGAIIVSLFLHLLVLVDIPTEETINNAILYPIVFGFAPQVFEAMYIFIPQVREFFEIFIRNADINNSIM
jgi:uncharacterized membrane protein required for colicin V production